MKLFNVVIEKKNTEVLDKLHYVVMGAMKDAVARQSEILVEEIRNKYFTSSFGALAPDGKLAKSIKPYPAYEQLGPGISRYSVWGGADMGSLPWASNFIGPVGQIVNVTGKGKYLAIPMSKKADTMQRGVSSLSDLKLYRKGHLLFDRDASMVTTTKRAKGAPKKKTSEGSDKPLFILKQSQPIRAKIHPEVIAADNLFPVMSAIRREVFNKLKGTVNG